MGQRETGAQGGKYMEHSVEKLSSNKVKISFKATAAEFENALQQAYLKLRGQINVPGFRKGKAPRKLIENMFGKGVFYEDALDILFPEAYYKAVEENDLKPVARPEVDVQAMEAGKDLEFSCEVYVMPEVKLGQYKELDVTRTIRKVTDAEVDSRIEQEQKRVARVVDVTDPTQPKVVNWLEACDPKEYPATNTPKIQVADGLMIGATDRRARV